MNQRRGIGSGAGLVVGVAVGAALVMGVAVRAQQGAPEQRAEMRGSLPRCMDDSRFPKLRWRGRERDRRVWRRSTTLVDPSIVWDFSYLRAR